MAVGTRVKNLIQYEKISQIQLARELGITTSRLNSYLLGRTEPDYDTLIKIADALNTTVDYILGLTDNAMPYCANIDKQPSASSLYSETGDFPRYAIIPMYLSSCRTDSSGEDSATENTPYGQTKISSAHNRLYKCQYTLLITDDSMLPEIKPNDVAFIQTSEQKHVSGNMYAVRLSGYDRIGVTLRRCFFEDNKIVMIPENKAYGPTVVIPDKLDYEPLVGSLVRIYREIH